MVFGTTTFKCDECGNQFVAMAAEWRATCFLIPMQCPQCGSCHTIPAGNEIFRPIYKKIWENGDKSKGGRKQR